MDSASVCAKCFGKRTITRGQWKYPCDICTINIENNKLKPFNLERALAGDPVVTRSGFKVVDIYCFKKKREPFNIAYMIEKYFNDIFFCSNDGTTQHRDSTEYDLLMAPVKKKYYMAISLANTIGGLKISSHLYDDIKILEEWCNHNLTFYKIIEIDIEE